MNILVLGYSFTGRYLAARVAGSFPGSLRVAEETFARLGALRFLSRDPEAVRGAGLLPFDPGESLRFGLVLDTVPVLVEEQPAYLDFVRPLMIDGDPPTYVHVSSTSVYPDRLGEPGRPSPLLPALDENSEVEQSNPRALKRLHLERAVRRHYPQACLLRSAGLYGPGRALPLMIQNGNLSRVAAENKLVSRIHVADLLRLAISLAQHPAPGPSVVNGVDCEPSPNAVTFDYLEKLLGITLDGPWRTTEPSGRSITSLYARALIGDYEFPTFREGFVDALRSSG